MQRSSAADLPRWRREDDAECEEGKGLKSPQGRRPPVDRPTAWFALGALLYLVFLLFAGRTGSLNVVPESDPDYAYPAAALAARSSGSGPLLEDLALDAIVRELHDKSTHEIEEMALAQAFPHLLRDLPALVAGGWNATSLAGHAQAAAAHRSLVRLRVAMRRNNRTRMPALDSAATALERRVYPWLRRPLSQLNAPASRTGAPSRGLVVTCGRGQAMTAAASLRALREGVGSSIAVTIAYAGDADLPLEYREALERWIPRGDGLEFLDLTAWVDESAKMEGWAVKPFALLLAPYDHAILIDADVYWLQPPETLFTDPGYLATGALFFHDRTVGAARDLATWAESWLPAPSSHARALRSWRGLSLHEQESGVVAVDRTVSLPALAAAASLNARPLRDAVYAHIHGDKETFWLAWEAVSAQYAFVPGFGSAIGRPPPPPATPAGFRYPEGKTVCGGLLHADRAGNPLWFNGGLEVDKWAQPGRLLRFSHYLLDNDAANVAWMYGASSPEGYCLAKFGVRAVPVALEQGMIALLDGFLVIYNATIASGVWAGKLS
ncbi:hypothetical protein H9P43_001954 [Blastocladiella emersonii ATCC 22665]|nr:hypothetical protein H9P43_001954 [Blastocladiella emersonii ATCC 22665]